MVCAHIVPAWLLGMPDAVLCGFPNANTSSLFVLFVMASLIHLRAFCSAWRCVSCDVRWQGEHAGSPAASAHSGQSVAEARTCEYSQLVTHTCTWRLRRQQDWLARLLVFVTERHCMHLALSIFFYTKTK